MITRRTFLKYTGATALTWYAVNNFGVLNPIAQIPGGTLDPSAIPKFATSLLIPPVMPKAGTIVQRGGKNVDYYEISMEADLTADFAQRFARHDCVGVRCSFGSKQKRIGSTQCAIAYH